MKQLLAGIVLILIIGIGSLIYRNALERPMGEYHACTLEARVCPDGSTVGRVGPACSFAPCMPPNVEHVDAGISFVAPTGFVEGAQLEVSNLIAGYSREDDAEIRDAITVRQFFIAEGQAAEEVLFAQAYFSPRGENATSLADFVTEEIGGRMFYTATLERFEAQVHTAYYLVRERDVLAFEAVDRSVSEWMSPSLDIKTLPTQAALRELLETLQVAP